MFDHIYCYKFVDPLQFVHLHFIILCQCYASIIQWPPADHLKPITHFLFIPDFKEAHSKMGGPKPTWAQASTYSPGPGGWRLQSRLSTVLFLLIRR